MSVVELSHVRKRFNLEAGFFARYGRFVNAVNDISFKINDNEAYGLVGESGCGKTTTARLLVRMYEIDGGSILYYPEQAAGQASKGQGAPSGNTKEAAPLDIAVLAGENLRAYRRKVRYVFQDPARSLNPRMSVYEILVSGARWSGKRFNAAQPHKAARKACEKELRRQAAAVLSETGLSPDDLDRRPSEFSGGQRQRISIARALLMQPRLLICDEVVSALDVSIQGQILNLLLEIREKRDISFLFIAHDLKVACYFCDRIGVMYRGELMEEAPAGDLYISALHPYTRLLFESAIHSDSASAHNIFQNQALAISSKNHHDIKMKPDHGCAFAHRCPQAAPRCFSEKPEMRESENGHLIRCLLY